MSTRPNKIKRRRLQGACDVCRQRKIRCDSGSMPDNICSHCLEFGLECTHIHANQKLSFKVPLARKGDLRDQRSWDERRAEMQPLLDSILSPTYQAPTNPAIVRNTLISLASYATYLQESVTKSLPPTSPVLDMDLPRLSGPLRQVFDYVEQPECLSGALVDELSQSMQSKLTLSLPSEDHFFGFSSDRLVRTALEYARDSTEPAQLPPPSTQGMSFKRSQFWTVHPWDKTPVNPQLPYTFPEPDLLDHLVDCYFKNSDLFIPVLHRPSFERSLKEGLHVKDPGFGGVVLVVCAVGARHSKDKRVIPDGVDSGLELGAGTRWFRQLGSARHNFPSTPSLYELQIYLLSAIYLHGSSTAEKCWYLIGTAIRAAQDAGVHRRSRTGGPPTIEKELQKRVWWGLILADAIVSIACGRPRAIHPSDYDVELPIECDSEYWENPDPELAFKQPPGIPSKVTSMIKSIELLTILGSAHIAFYSINKPSLSPDVEAQTLADHDSALNSWVDSVPEHLRWNPNRADDSFFDQSAYLLATYYWVQMLIHIPFIDRKDDLARSSFAICTNASRACSRLLERYSPRGWMSMPQIQAATFKSALILLMGIWRGKDAGFAFDEQRELENVYRCSRISALYETRWVPAGRCMHSRSPIPSSSSPATSSSREGYRTPGLGSDYPMYTSELSQPLFLSENSQRSYQDGTDSFLTGGFNPMFGQPNAGYPVDSSHSHGGGAYTPMISVNEPATSGSSSLAPDNPSMWAGVLPEFHWTAWNAYLSNPADSQQRTYNPL
ncbi:fungal-specific transcription factor domain-containing protein [Coprinopsis sp. MPI-PUGE-AT-0042]|nr:fungal-specific transcription factor domain-containing protein [Coprinopsis sp. MPI-PUGE-AT-0042]